MSGTARVKPPKTDAEWARNIQKRVDQTEHPASSRVGDWVLSTSPDTGNLVASNVNGGSVILAQPPAEGAEGDPDAVASDVVYLGLQYAGSSAAANAAIPWDTLVSSSGWEEVVPVSTITVPRAGFYMVAAVVVWETDFSNHSQVSVRSGSQHVLSRSQNVGGSEAAWIRSLGIAGGLALTEGQTLSVTCAFAERLGPNSTIPGAVSSWVLHRLGDI